MYDSEIVHKVHDDLVGEICRLQGKIVALNAKVAELTSTNNGSTPCRFFSRDKVCTGKAADGGNMYQSVPWCNHEPSQRAVP